MCCNEKFDEKILMSEMIKDLLAAELGKKLIEFSESINFEEIAEKKAVSILKEVQRIIKKEELPEVMQIRMIEELLLENNLGIGCACE